MPHFTSNGTDQYQNSSSNLLNPYREQPQSTRIAVAYPRQAFSPTKRTNHAPISCDQQVQVSQGHMSYSNKENCNTEVHGGGGLELVKPARPKPFASLKKRPRNLARSPLLSVRVFDSRHEGSALRWVVEDRAALRLRQIWCLLIP